MLLTEASKTNGTMPLGSRYKGLFSSRNAPTARAYFILFSFFLGVLLITLGAVFCNVILTQPPPGGAHVIHVPPVPVACALIVFGVVCFLSSIGTAWRYGFDDGDDEKFTFAQDDVLDQHHQRAAPARNLPV
ncbi:uncharacterized protein LOC135222080 [Macrobrachium nipponense]|uniref:uncharacterized protein LOC135222080 n=1 Tax=Macrobrachium nipponense TaxID=159736 RepID=UPI0030C83DF4